MHAQTVFIIDIWHLMAGLLIYPPLVMTVVSCEHSRCWSIEIIQHAFAILECIVRHHTAAGISKHRDRVLVSRVSVHGNIGLQTQWVWFARAWARRSWRWIQHRARRIGRPRAAEVMVVVQS